MEWKMIIKIKTGMKSKDIHWNIQNIQNGVHTASALVVIKVRVKVKIFERSGSHSNFEAPLNGWELLRRTRHFYNPR